MHLKIHTPPVVHFSKIFHRGAWILNGVIQSWIQTVGIWHTWCNLSQQSYACHCSRKRGMAWFNKKKKKKKKQRFSLYIKILPSSCQSVCLFSWLKQARKLPKPLKTEWLTVVKPKMSYGPLISLSCSDNIYNMTVVKSNHDTYGILSTIFLVCHSNFPIFSYADKYYYNFCRCIFNDNIMCSSHYDIVSVVSKVAMFMQYIRYCSWTNKM